MSDTILYASNNTGAILTSTAQGPNGALASPTGTGVVLAASSAIVGTALGGTVIGQVLTWAGSQWVASTPANQSPTGTGLALVAGSAFVSPALGGTSAGQIPVWSGTQWISEALSPPIIAQAGATTGQVMAWNGTQWGGQTLAGDAAGPYSALVVSAVHGQAVAAGTSSGQVWTYNGTSWAPGTVAAASIAPGSSTQVLTTTGGVAVWAAPAAGGITQLTSDVTAGPGSGSQAATVVAAQSGLLAFAATTGLATWATGATGPGLAQVIAGNGVTPVGMTLSPQAPNAGSGTTASGTPGSFVVALAAPVSTGNEAYFEVKRAGVAYAFIGAYNGNPGYAALWLGEAITTTSANAAISVTATGITQVNGSNSYGLLISGAYSLYGDSTGVVVEKNLYVGADPGVYAGGAGVLGLAKAGTNPSASISTGGVIYADSSTGAICLYPAGVTAAALTAANGTIYTAAILQVGSTLAVNGGSSGPSGGGVGVIALNNATTQPTAASVSGGAAISSSGGQITFFDSHSTTVTIGSSSGANNVLTWSANITQVGLAQTANAAASGTGALMNIAAQICSGTASTGGGIQIFTGQGTTAHGALTLDSATGTGTAGAWVWNGPTLATSGSTNTGGFAVPALVKGYPVTINGIACKILVCLP